MQSEEQAHSVGTEVPAIAEPLPQYVDTKPLVQISSGATRRLTTRQIAKRRRQRLQLLLQQAHQPMSQ
jgi:hypothetical protein